MVSFNTITVLIDSLLIFLFLNFKDFELFMEAQKLLKYSNQSECVDLYGKKICYMADRFNEQEQDKVGADRTEKG
jgi:hypothetical protein